jgi:flagellar biosynthesis protein FliQ
MLVIASIRLIILVMGLVVGSLIMSLMLAITSINDIAI